MLTFFEPYGVRRDNPNEGNRAPDKKCVFISRMPISSQNPVFDLLLEPSHCGNSNKWSNMGIGEAITQLLLIEVKFRHLL